jgi:DNA-binding CsgD family transcriptional regulator
MARLRHLEVKTLSHVLLELYSPGPTDELPSRLFAALRRCFSCDNYCYNELLEDRAVRIVHEPAFPESMETFNHYLDQHPSINAIVKYAIQRPVRISDFTSLSEWCRSDLFNTFFRLAGLNYQLAFMTLDHPRLGIALNRSKQDFSEEERLMLDVLRPHIVQIYKTNRLFSSLSDATAAHGHAYILTDKAGRIRFATGKAIGWLREYFGEHHGSLLPDQLRDWVRRHHSHSFDDQNLGATLREFSIQREQKRLVVQSLSPLRSEEYQLVLRESIQPHDATPLKKLGLTKREAEVLLWVSQGKRNSEIGQILGARERTIYKHLERVFAKLSVETRTAAANIAFEVFSTSARS